MSPAPSSTTTTPLPQTEKVESKNVIVEDKVEGKENGAAVSANASATIKRKEDAQSFRSLGFAVRRKEFRRLESRHRGVVGVVVHSEDFEFTTSRFLVPCDLTFGAFQFLLRKHMVAGTTLSPSRGLFVFAETQRENHDAIRRVTDALLNAVASTDEINVPVASTITTAPSLTIKATKADVLVCVSTLMSAVQREYSDADGFLYLTVCAENAFGCC
jgi:hypothetical protein